MSIASRLKQQISENIIELPDTLLVEDCLYEVGFESMAMMQLILLLEKEYGLSVEPNDLTRQNFQSIESIAQLIAQKTRVSSVA